MVRRDPVIHFDPAFVQPVDLGSRVGGDRVSCESPGTYGDAMFIANGRQDLLDRAKGFKPDVSEHDDIGVRCPLEKGERSSWAWRQEKSHAPRCLDMCGVPFLERTDSTGFPFFVEKRSLGKDDADRVFIYSSTEVSNRLEFSIEIGWVSVDEDMPHPMSDDVDIGLPSKVFLQGVKDAEPTLSEQHCWEDGIEKTSMSTHHDGIAVEERFIEFACVDGDRDEPRDRGDEGGRPPGHDPRIPRLACRAFHSQTKRRDQPGSDDKGPTSEIDEEEHGDQRHCPRAPHTPGSGRKIRDHSDHQQYRSECDREQASNREHCQTHRSANPWSWYVIGHVPHRMTVLGASLNPVEGKVNAAESPRIRFTGAVTSLAPKLFERWRLGVDRQVSDLAAFPRPGLGDVIGGVSVALVLIPQSLAYANLAGLPPVVGLFAAAFPLLIFAVFASSPFLQTGPVALTSLLTAGALAAAGLEPETEAYIGAAAILAIVVGVSRAVIGILRLGSIVYLMAEPVTIGFTSGAGLVILSSQLPRALGADLPADVTTWGNPMARAGWAILHPGSWTFIALVMSAATLVLMLRGRRIHRLFPGVLVAVVVALLYSRGFDYTGAVIPDVEAGLPRWSLDLPWASTGSLITGGLVIALVGFAEPASIARTFANEDQIRWSSSREFFASGLANTVAGLTGAYPVGGSFSRSSINRLAGAETRASGAITGLVVLAFLPFAALLDGLPDAVLGAIVVGAVVSLVKPKRLFRLWRRSPWQAALAWITFIATLLTPPNVQYAVLLGVAVTALLHVVRPFHLDVDSTADGELHLRPRGLLWIATNSKLKEALRDEIAADDGSGPVLVSLDRSTAIDAAIADAVAAGQAAAELAGRKFRVTNVPDGGTLILENFGLDVI